jgi:hypothetical protein
VDARVGASLEPAPAAVSLAVAPYIRAALALEFENSASLAAE